MALISSIYDWGKQEQHKYYRPKVQGNPIINSPKQLKRNTSYVIKDIAKIKPTMRLVSQLNEKYTRFTMRLNSRCDELTIRRVK